jgi:hypothetical protein
MPKFKVSLPFTERIIEADDADEACDRFRDDETIFYELEAEPAEEPLPAPELDPAELDFLRIFDEMPQKAPQTP